LPWSLETLILRLESKTVRSIDIFYPLKTYENPQKYSNTGKALSLKEE
jgi:hypothetical protein